MRTIEAVIGAVKEVGGESVNVHLTTGDGGDGDDPWLTVRRVHYPRPLWPPRAGDIVTVTVPTVVKAARPKGGGR